MAAPSTGSLVKWSDITNLFNELNTVRQKWGYTAVSATTGGQNNLAKVNTLTEIENYIEQMNGNSYVSTGYNQSTGQTYPNSATVDYVIPNIGDLIKPAPLTAYFDTLNRVNNVCAFNGSFFASDFGFFPFGSNFGFSPFSGNNGFSPFGSNNGFSPFSSNNGFSPFSSNNGFNPFGGWFSSFSPKSSFFT